MRPIKFRAWDTKRKCWDFDQGIAMAFPYDANWNGQFRTLSLHDAHKVFMQYTGLKDKNGEEIYEGDIVRTVDDQHPIGQVLWSMSGGWYFNDRKLHNYLGNMPFLEVIGNIYETPELIK